MDPQVWLAYLAAVVALMLLPGPNVALIVANSLRNGVRHGLITVVGTSVASAIQVSLAGIGLCTMLGQLGHWFAELRWIGVAYLVYLGIREWRSVPLDLTAVGPVAERLGPAFRRGVVVALTNPKTLFFYGAFFPQFIAADRALAPQIAILVGTLLVTAALVDTGWALLAVRLRPIILGHDRLRSRLTGGLMIGAGATLALARIR